MELHPIDTRKIFKKHQKDPAHHLWYQIHYDQYRQLGKNEKKQINVIDLGEKKYILKDIQKDIKKIYFHKDIQTLGKRVSKNRLSALMELSNAHLRILKGKLTKSIVQGLGYEHVRETSLSIHPIYGFPYIPGSSIKGLVRRWFIEAFLEGDESQLVKSDRQLAEVGREIFGIQDQQGVVQFLDIYMFSNVKISNDIMTPHFSDYYDGKKAASDTLGPVPIYFYTVGVEVPEIEILFIVRGGKNSRYPKEIIGKIVADWTKGALLELGLGAKTSSGYGFFRNVIDVTEQELKKKIDEKIRLKEEKRKELEVQKKKKEVEKMLKAKQEKLIKLTPLERLIFEIESLNADDKKDIEYSKTELYERVLESKDKQAASALKAFWEKTNDWHVKKKQKKQYNKVMNISNIINGL